MESHVEGSKQFIHDMKSSSGSGTSKIQPCKGLPLTMVEESIVHHAPNCKASHLPHVKALTRCTADCSAILSVSGVDPHAQQPLNQGMSPDHTILFHKIEHLEKITLATLKEVRGLRQVLPRSPPEHLQIRDTMQTTSSATYFDVPY